ncbi:MAG TPA: DUF1080 domain-containing protein [Lacipirellulaceae bacterium]|nr:DUF1080 domain-containing protein [Lacipirellulaceae bacterium]
MRNAHIWLLTLVVLFLGAVPAAAASEDEAPQPDEDGWYSLFNGKDLTGWKKAEENEDTIKVVDGEIVIKGERCHLFYDGPVNDANFKNFEWKCEVLTKPHANSGMYFHTKYQRRGFPRTGIEVQVNNSHSDPIRTGSLYGAKNIMNDSPAKDNEWFTQHVIVEGRKITVKVNDKVVNEFEEQDPPQRRRSFEGNVLGSGTFALQGHDPGSEVHYRKITVKPLP